MTYIATLDPEFAGLYDESVEIDFPDWQESEGLHDRFLTESDFPVYDDSVDESRVPDEDWQAMAEALWVDPAERDW